MSISAAHKSAQLKKARLKFTNAVRTRQNSVRAFNATVNLLRICMKTGTDTSDVKEMFKDMTDAIKAREYDDVIFLQREIFSSLTPNINQIRHGSTMQAPTAPAPYKATAPTPAKAPVPVSVPATPGPSPPSAPSAVSPPPPTPSPSSMLVDAFEVEDVFVVYNDGRLIYHSAKTVDDICVSISDDHIMSSMLVAIQHFIRDSMGKGGELGSFEFGENKILMEQGRYTFLAVVLSGKEPPNLREEMATAVHKFEGLYSGIIETWDGDTSFFEDCNEFIDTIATYHTRFKFKKKSKEDIRVMSALEFYQGFIRLKVAVKNRLDTLISDTSLKLTYNRKALLMSHIEPNYPIEGSTVELGNVQPGEKKTVAFFLDPLICMETYIDGTLIYRDYKGILKTVIMKRRPADIVCPLFYTDTNINTAMLKRLIDEVKYNDTRIYQIPKSISSTKAFELVKQAVQRHHVRFVREFIEKAPYVAEAWYYGKIHTVGEEMIIRTTVREKTRSIEIFVSSGNLATLTGLLAELGTDLKGMLKDHLTDGEEEVKRLDDENTKKKIKKSNLLIDKFLEGEVAIKEDEMDAPPGTPRTPPPPPTPKHEPDPPPKKEQSKKKDDSTSLEDLLNSFSK